jgi:hypothetical protein
VKYFPVIFIFLIFSCKKDIAVPKQAKSVCGTEGWPQGNWKVKCTVKGTTSPDSVTFDINGGQVQFGTYYSKRFHHPLLTLKDSVDFCGNLNSDINVNIYSADTTKIFISSIFLNNVLVKIDTVHTVSNTYRTIGIHAQCK